MNSSSTTVYMSMHNVFIYIYIYVHAYMYVCSIDMAQFQFLSLSLRSSQHGLAECNAEACRVRREIKVDCPTRTWRTT